MEYLLQADTETKVGDKLWIQAGSWRRSAWIQLKVVKVGKARLTALEEDGSQHYIQRSSGRVVGGDKFDYAYKDTERMKDVVANDLKERRLKKLRSAVIMDVSLRYCSDETAERIYLFYVGECLRTIFGPAQEHSDA